MVLHPWFSRPKNSNASEQQTEMAADPRPQHRIAHNSEAVSQTQPRRPPVSMARPFDPTDPLQLRSYAQPFTADDRSRVQRPLNFAQQVQIRAQERVADVPGVDSYDPVQQPFQRVGPLTMNKHHMSFTSTANERLVRSRQFTRVSSHALMENAAPKTDWAPSTTITRASGPRAAARDEAATLARVKKTVSWAPEPQKQR